MHLMIDLETLATTPDAAILTIGACKFDPHGDDRDKATRKMPTFYKRVELQSNVDLGRRVDESTLRWWCDQSEKISHEAFAEENRHELKTVMKEFYKFGWGTERVWAHGSIFDVVIIENVCRSIEQAVPWDFWNIRDTRTIFELAEPDMPDLNGHHALYDAMRQAIGVQNCHRKLTSSVSAA